MAFESAMKFHRLMRRGMLVLGGMLSLGSLATAQTAVTTGSVVPVIHSTAWGQIMKVQVAKNGSVVFLDWSTSGLYQLPLGSTTFTTIASGSPLEATGTYWNSGMTMDAQDTIYLADRYGASHFFRIPYNPKDGTWDFTSANSWGATITSTTGSIGLQTFDVAFINSSAKDGSGTLVFSTETSPSIYTIPVDNQGNWGTATTVIKGLKAKAAHLAADANGNIYFLEDEGVAASSRVTGVFFIPAGTTGISGAGDGSAEAQIARIDPATNTAQFSGITLDSAGNIYLSSQSDSNGGAFNGDLMVPNTSGSPTGVTAASFNFDAATFITPVQSSAPLAIDKRGYLWIPTSTSGWTPPGSTAYPGTHNVVLWQPGAANVGTSPVGTAGTPGTVFFNFSQLVTPGSLVFSQPGSGSDFVASATNPIADPAATTPQLPCTAGKSYNANSSCPYFVSLNPRLPGAVSGQLKMLDATGNLIAQSSTYLYGIGQGPDISLAVPISETPLATGLVTPQQAAADTLGNAYIADSGQGKVLKFAAGAAASAGVSVGKSLSAPTGVAVDAAGDVFIADSGKVIEVPFLNGALNAAGQTTLQAGLGSNLKLAVDGAGTVYATDPDNSRIVKIPNSQTSAIVAGVLTLGSGFNKPSAIATDSAGDVFVADGSSLTEITAAFGVQSAITNSLAAPVTGLAVDPSGSVDIAQTGGIIHVPAQGGTLSPASAVAIGSAVTTPNSLAIDSFGNLYVSDLTGGKPNLELLSLNASVDFGQVSPFVPSNPVDVDVFNIGNLPLTIMPDPTFSGIDGAEFSVTPALQNACDTTGATPVTPGSSCILDVVLTAADVGTRSGTMMVTSNAINAPTVSAALAGTGVNNLERSSVSLVLTPSSGVTYPGSTSATVTVAPTVSTSVPTGQVVLTLINQNAKLHQVTTLPIGTLTGGSVTFSLTGILGGVYTVQAVYHGDSSFSGGLVKTTLTVAQAAPAVSLSEPSNTTPTLGVYYVSLGSNTTLQASIASKLGTPTGTVTFMNGSALADPTQPSTTLDANGTATFSTLNLPAGTYNLTAVYNGDQNFSTVTSPVIALQVIPPSLLITANPASLTVTAGVPGQTALTLQSLVGYEQINKNGGGVFIACDNTTVPKYSECTFDVPQVQVKAGTASISTLTLSTNLPVNVAVMERKSSPIAFASVFGLGLLGLVFGRKARLQRTVLGTLSLMLLLLGVGMGASGCTNSNYSTTPPSPHVTTPAGSYNIRLYATDPNTGAVKTLPFTLPVTVVAAK
ncbi:MAG: Ig-like domain repeat protein [Janthinobacterium lividum]